MERRDFLSAIPGLAIGGVGMSGDELLDSPETDWTIASKGEGSLSPKQMRVLQAKLDELDKWRKDHVGLDAWSAGPGFPHPSQNVRALYFFEGEGRLDPTGIQILNDPANLTALQRGLFWIAQFTDIPTSADPRGYVTGGVDYYSFPAVANDFGYVVNVGAVQGLSSANIKTTSGQLAGAVAPAVEIALAGEGGTGTFIFQPHRFFVPTNATVQFDGKSTDGTVFDGSVWYRSNLSRLRFRTGSTTYNLALEGGPQVVATGATKTTTYTATANDGLILCDATAGSFDVDLPDAATVPGLRLTIKKITAANTVNIDPNGTQTTDGSSTSIALTTQWSSRTLIAAGGAWYIESAYL